MERTEHVVKRFNAVDDAGNMYEVIVIQMFIKPEMRAGTFTQPAGRRYETSAGDPLRMIDEDTYEFIMDGRIIKKI